MALFFDWSSQFTHAILNKHLLFDNFNFSCSNPPRTTCCAFAGVVAATGSGAFAAVTTGAGSCFTGVGNFLAASF